MFLIFVIYIAFIGLGVPDSMFGTAWPQIYENFALPFSYGSFITTASYFGTVISSVNSARIIKKLGVGKVVALSTLLTAIALIGFALAPSFWVILLLTLPLGLGAGSIDNALNNYVAIHYSAGVMSFLHCFYGIGVTISPIILARTMISDNGWRNGYFVAALIQLLIATLSFIALPYWDKDTKSDDEASVEMEVLSLRQLLRTPRVKVMWVLFFTSCALECLCNAWGGTFMVEGYGMTPSDSARNIIVYFAGMALGRFVSGILSKFWDSFRIISFGIVFLIIGCVLLMSGLGSLAIVIGLALMAFGNGPVFPNLNYLTPRIWGESKSQAIIGSQMTVANLSFVLMPIVFGQVASMTTIKIFPYVLACIIMIFIFTWIFGMRRKAD